MEDNHLPNSTAAGTFCGTTLTILHTFDSYDVIKTVVLAGIGALVSFAVSLFLKWVYKKTR